MTKKKNGWGKCGDGGGIWFAGFLGSLVYYMQAATGFGSVLTGALKALIWPATIVYELLEGFYGLA